VLFNAAFPAAQVIELLIAGWLLMMIQKRNKRETAMDYFKLIPLLEGTEENYERHQ
jgi:hypothetical protein